ncbi:MAG: diguanylate cyclase [Spirochaetaceae bacterium]
MKRLTSVHGRIYTIVLLPIILFLGISYILFHFYVRTLVTEDSFTHLDTNLSLQATYIDNWLDERLEDIVLLSKGISSFSGDLEKIEEHLTRFTNLQTDFYYTALANSDGDTVADDTAETPLYVGDREYFHKAMEEGPVISKVLLGRDFKRPVIVFAAPVPMGVGEETGVLLGAVDITGVEKTLRDIQQTRHRETYIVEREGTFITRPSVASVFTDDSGKITNPILSKQLCTPIMERAQRGEHIKTPYENYAGKRVYGTYKPLNGDRWFLIGETETGIIYRRYSGYLSMLVIVILAGIFILIPIILRLVHTIAAPLRALDKEAQRMRTDRGKADSNWDPFRSAPVEIRNLAYSFFTMSEQLSEQVKALERITITDELTGLFNRKHLHEEGFRYIHMSRRTNLPLSALMIDIDHFKEFNDTYGHPFGDKVLKEVSRNLQNSVRESDLPARYGGEEFVVLAYKADAEQAMQLAERLRSAVAEQEHIYESDNDKKETLRVTISIGVSLLEEFFTGLNTRQNVASSMEKLLSAADKALYSAKEKGRNRVEFLSMSDATASEENPR